MASPNTFKYTPSAKATLFVISGVLCAIDLVQLTPTEIRWGVLERFADGTAQWMGPDANTSGQPAWTIETAESPLGPTAEPNPESDPKEPSQGLILDYVNGMGTSLLTDFKGIMNATLAARFPANAPGPVSGDPPFTTEAAAIAYLLAKISTVIQAPVNGQIP